MKVLNYLEEGLLALSLAVMVTINFGNVLSRYVLHASWSFSEELMVILFVYNSFLGAALAYRRGAHMGFTILTDALPTNMKKPVVVVSSILSLLLMGLLAYYGAEMVQSQIQYGQRTPALGLPEFLAGMAVPLGAVLIAFRICQACFCELSEVGVTSADVQAGVEE